MHAIHNFGLALIGLSAFLLAGHWIEWKDLASTPATSHSIGDQIFRGQRFRRRTQASALIGLVGFAMLLADRIPKNALALSGYLFGLILVACVILWLGVSDMVAANSHRAREEMERLAQELRSQQEQRGEAD